MRIRTGLIPDLTISAYLRLQAVVDLNPPYQREGGIWDKNTRARFIDSILNGLDVPKLYFERAITHRLTPNGLTYQYAVLDGKQRLEAINSFAEGTLSLPGDFQFYEDSEVEAGGMTLEILEREYPHVAERFFDYLLPIVSVTTNSGDLIEEMFQRLNSASSLNAAERRNAISGPARDATNTLAEHELLAKCSPIRNARYKHRELASKFLAIENQIRTRGHVSDTKAATLERLFRATSGANPTISAAQMDDYRAAAHQTLDRMCTIFTENDRLLASIGTVVVYYLATRDPELNVVRQDLETFETLRQAARIPENDEPNLVPAMERLREYNVLVQSTNDGSALERRAEIMSAFLRSWSDDESYAGLVDLSAGSDIPEEVDGMAD